LLTSSRLQPGFCYHAWGFMMSSHVFHELLVHINWHTKGDHPTLQGQVHDLAYALLRAKSRSMKGVRLHALGGTETHLHLAVEIEPFVKISDLVQELKGATAHEVNRRTGRKTLQWQRGYGVVSFGRKNLPWIVEYIEHQPEHHGVGSVHQRLESCEPAEAQTQKPG
jgi:putative transposase